nr:hypothetical protein [Dorea formicigenerans]
MTVTALARGVSQKHRHHRHDRHAGGEDHNQVSIRYLSEHSEIDGAVTTEPRLEDLYLWLFPQTDLEKEDR